MFNRKMEKSTKEEAHGSNNIIGKGTIIEGTMQTSGNLRVEGKIIGDVRSKSKIVVGKSAYIDGNILSDNVEISGEVKGVLRVSGVLTLKSTAIVHGDIHAKELVIEPGAKFEGQCKMDNNIKELGVKSSFSSKDKMKDTRNVMNRVSAI